MEIWISLIVSLFDMSLYRRYLDVYLGELQTTSGISAVFLLSAAVINATVERYIEGWFVIPVFAVVLFVFTRQYKSGVMSRAMAACLYMGIIVIALPIAYVLYRTAYGSLLESQETAYYFAVFSMEVIKIILVEVTCRVKERRAVHYSMVPRSVGTILFMIPVASLISCIILVEVTREVFSTRVVILCMCILYTIIGTNYLVFLMMGRYTTVAEEQHEEELLLQEAAYKEEYYQDVDRYIEEIQDIRHDMKNRLSAICDLAEHEEPEQIREMVLGMLDGIRLAEDMLYTVNPVVNSILKVKMAKAQERGIRIESAVFIPRRLSVETGDMGVLYGNPLDNAIEACCRMQEGEKSISIESRYQNGKLFIKIRNSKTSEGNPGLLTSKIDRKRHGRGIRLLRQVVERYHGTVELTDQGEIFETRIVLREVEQLG